MKKSWMAGMAAGLVNGLFGAGGGMVLVPMLKGSPTLSEEALFPTSVAIMLFLSGISLGVYGLYGEIPWWEAMPYLIGGGLGGFLSVPIQKKIPPSWLHRALGLLILGGGVRFLC